MNRTEAKARAAELGINKDTARQYGSLSKTQTWLDAISAYELQMKTQDATEVHSEPDLLKAECEQPAVDIQEIQADAISLTIVTPILSDPWDAADDEAEPLATVCSAEAQPVYTVENDDTQVEFKMLLPEGGRPVPLPEASSNTKQSVDSRIPVYPLLLLCVAVWILGWAACQLLVGLTFCLKLGLKRLASQVNSMTNERLKPRERRSDSPGIACVQLMQ